MEKRKDERFAKIRNDPRFKPLPRNKKKVQIDRRFEGMFKDPKFKLKYQVDKRGRPITLSSNDHLKRYYDLDSSEDSSDSASEDDQNEEIKLSEAKEAVEKKETNGEKVKKIKEKGIQKTPVIDSEVTKKGKKKKEGLVTSGDVKQVKDNKGKVNRKSEAEISKVLDLKSVKPSKSKGIEITGVVSPRDEQVKNKKEKSKVKGTVSKTSKVDVKESTDEESESEDELPRKGKVKLNRSVKFSKEEFENETREEEKEEDEQTEDDDSEEGVVEDKLKDLSLDYARGEGVFATDSSDDSEASAVEDEEEEVAHPWGELDADAERTEEATSRLAICNMDWDRIHAVDLMVLLNSFVPQNASIKSVTIYPSEFGLERLKEEELRGPKELAETKVLSSDEEDESGDEYQTEKLRQYQLNRLKYYYAVAEFDSPETASKVYDECDGMEYESSATKLDLRYVPDDMEFEHAPKDQCTALPDLTRYEPKFFVNTALQQAQVQLTWEENDPLRKANMEKLFDASKQKKGAPLDDNVIRQYLATSSSEGEESGIDDVGSDSQENLDSVAKYRALLAGLDKEENKEDKDMEMEISWGVGLKEKAEKLVEKKLSGKDKLTPWEQYLEKKKEKKKLKKEKVKEKEESQTEEDEDEMDDIPSDVDLNDPYFREEFENNPDFKPMKKPTKSKKPQEEVVNSDSDQSDHRKAELELLLGDNDDGRKHFSLKKIMKNEEQEKKKKKKGKRKEESEVAKQEDDFTIKVDDPRFSALFSSHHYSVDPSDPNFKKTKAMEAILVEKQKRRAREPDLIETPPAKQAKPGEKKMDPQLSSLVRNLKSKVNTAKLKSNKKF